MGVNRVHRELPSFKADEGYIRELKMETPPFDISFRYLIQLLSILIGRLSLEFQEIKYNQMNDPI